MNPGRRRHECNDKWLNGRRDGLYGVIDDGRPNSFNSRFM